VRKNNPHCGNPDFLTVEGDIINYRTIGKTDYYETKELRNGFCQEKSIQRNGTRSFFGWFYRYFQRKHQQEPRETDNERCHKNGVEPIMLKNENACHGTQGKGNIGSDPEITDAFPSAGGGEHIHRNGVTRGSHKAE
jgi:hypothetical protein